ncbi:MAG: ABC-2 family transporter protein [Ilumatobacteraceae bacterium]
MIGSVAVGDRGLRRYFGLLAIFWRSTFATELEYRANFFARAAMSVFWTVWAALGVRVFFQFSDSIAGWDYGELIVVIGMFFSVNGLRQALFEPNLDRMTEYVRNGTLDFLLTKPVNTQFMVSFRHLGVYNLLDPVLGLALSAVGLAVIGRRPSVANLASFTVMLAVAVVLLYALTLSLIAAAVRLVNSDGLGAVAFVTVELSRFPVQLYRNPVQTILTIVPVAFLTTFPAQAMLGRLDPWLLVVGPAVAVSTVGLGSIAFRRSLRSYAGASG